MPAQSPLGRVFTLNAGDARVEIIQTGAHIRAFTVDDRAIIVPFGDDLPWGAHGAVLAPWPNRIADGRYVWDSESHQLPITEPRRNAAIHGLAMTLPWEGRVEGQTAIMTLNLEPSPGYPFRLGLQVSYTLTQASPGEAALDVTFTARNLGERAAPFGVGFHPWIAAGPGGLERATLQIDAGSHFVLDDRLMPTGESEIPSTLDFRTARKFARTVLDDAFGQPLTDDDGRSWVRLERADGMRTSVWMEAPLRVWQLFSGDDPAPREGIAVEPMSCAANAFNTGHLVHRIEPSETFEARWGITATR